MAGGTGIGKTYTTYKERSTTPATPGATYDRFFFKSDGLHYVNSTGTDILVGAQLSMTTSTDPAGTPTFAAVTTAIVNAYAGVIITTTGAGNAQTIQSPTAATAGKIFTVVNNDTSTNSIAVNGITLAVGKGQSFIWDGTAWGPTDLGITAIPVPVNQGGTGSATGNISGLDCSTPPAIGGTTPLYGRFSPAVSKGPAIITSFAGTVSTSGSSTTITFSSAADAILAGYSATAPVVGTTIITGAIKQASVTRYVVSWTNSTTCVVDSACTLAAETELTSVQLPIATFVNSAGVTQGVITADGVFGNIGGGYGRFLPTVLGMFLNPNSTAVQATIKNSTGVEGGFVTHSNGNMYFGTWSSNPLVLRTNNTDYIIVTTGGNILTGGLTAAGTSAAKVLAIGGGTMPTTLVADAVQMGVAEYNGATGDQRLNIYSEATVAKKTALGSGTLSINGAVTSGGGFTRQLAEATSGTLSGATGSIAVNVPSGARILGVQLRVDTAVTFSGSDTTWKAVYVNTPTTAICTTQAVTKSTRFNALHPAYEITTGTVTITVSSDGSDTFTAGVIRGIVYYEAIDAMTTAP